MRSGGKFCIVQSIRVNEKLSQSRSSFRTLEYLLLPNGVMANQRRESHDPTINPPSPHPPP